MPAPDVKIRRVIVNPAGPDILGEAVFLHNGGTQDVDLTGWKLSDTLNHPGPTYTFKFPQFRLLAGADVAIHTRAGTNDAHNLFWGRPEAVWNNDGDRVTLFDSTGVEIDNAQWPPLHEGLVIDTTEIERALAGAGPIGDIEQPSGPVQWTTQGPNGGEIFWQEFGAKGAAFHEGFPDSRPPSAPAPEGPIIKVSQSIYLKYLELGGPRVMGRPLSRRHDVPTTGGRQVLRQEFEGGTICRSARTGAHLVRGAIREKWLSPDVGGASGRLGLPISDERVDNSGVIFSDFEHGSIWFTQEAGAEVLDGLVIESTGFHCFGEQVGAGSDEVYFEIDVSPLNPQIEAPRDDIDGVWFTVLPSRGPVYENVDSGSTVADTNPVFIGRAAPLVVKAHLWEHDEGDPNAFREEIGTAVAAVGVVTAAFVPAASFVATNPQVQAAVTNIINRVADTGDDFIGRGQFVLGSRRDILTTLHAPPVEEFSGVPNHRSIFLTDGDASYRTYFTLRRWEP